MMTCVDDGAGTEVCCGCMYVWMWCVCGQAVYVYLLKRRSISKADRVR